MKDVLYVLFYEGKLLKLPRYRIKCAYDSPIKARQIINGILKQKIKIDISKVTIEKYVRAIE